MGGDDDDREGGGEGRTMMKNDERAEAGRHHPPPASQATAHGVVRGWNDDEGEHIRNSCTRDPPTSCMHKGVFRLFFFG